MANTTWRAPPEGAEMISVKALAERLGIARSTLLKSLKSRGTQLYDVRGTDTGFQSAKAVTVEDADSYEAWRGASGAAFNTKSLERPSGVAGLVYLIQPDAEARPNYLKVGWTTNPVGRFAEYRTICPHLRIVRFWAAHQQAIEVTALSVAKSNSDKQIAAEMFEGDLDRMIKALDQLFVLLGVLGSDP